MILPASTSMIRKQNLDVLVIDNAKAQTQISLMGAHVLSYKPKADNQERLWLSSNAKFDGKHAIRGGIPVCWPWFGDSHGQNDKTLPAHGYVRKQIWRLVSCTDTEQGTELLLEPTTNQGAGFSGEAKLSLKILVAERLTLQLITENVGSKPFNYTAALHSYFAIGDISQTELSGLSGHYQDKTRDFRSFETPTPYQFFEETDRVHLCTQEAVLLKHSAGETAITSKGHDSWVVWNPWQENAITMADMSDDGYQQMLCVETAITQGLTVAPGEKSTLVQTIS